MKKIKLIFTFLMLILHFSCSRAQNSSAQNSPKSIAVILKITGDENHVRSTEVEKYNIYSGTAKKITSANPDAASTIRIKAFNEKNEIIFDGYFDNPLKQKLESFEENGKVSNTIKKETSGYINIRVALSNGVKDIKLNCYMISGQDKEKLVSTNQITLK
ncbi:MAG: hypothetical protein JWN78_1582 [Bacteroidota bacterium]|nr:hypothetical protein [Bacteroidota bacterium]